MFGIACPHCNRALSLLQRKGLLFHHSIFCIYCAKPVKTSTFGWFSNSVIAGVFIGFILSYYTNLGYTWLFIIVLVFVVFFQRFVDIFAPLAPADNDDFL